MTFVSKKFVREMIAAVAIIGIANAVYDFAIKPKLQEHFQ